MKSTKNYMSQEDFNRVIETIPQLGIKVISNEDAVMLFKILYWAALRFEEGCRLKFEDIDLERREIALGKTKTEKQGVAVIGTPIMDELTEWLATKKPGRLFEGLTYNTAIRWIYRLGEMLEIEAWIKSESEIGEKTKSHIFRKSIGKDMMNGTHNDRRAPINTISRQLRHKDTKTTEKYINVENAEVKDYWGD